MLIERLTGPAVNPETVPLGAVVISPPQPTSWAIPPGPPRQIGPCSIDLVDRLLHAARLRGLECLSSRDEKTFFVWECGDEEFGELIAEAITPQGA